MSDLKFTLKFQTQNKIIFSPVTMIKIFQKYLWRKFHELSTLLGISDDS